LQERSQPPGSRSASPLSTPSHSRSPSIPFPDNAHTGILETGRTSAIEDFGTRKPFSPYESGLVKTLEIATDTTRLIPPQNLQDQFRRYLAVTAALDKLPKITQWPERPPTAKQVIELFIGKTQWTGVWRPNFARVTKHFPQMTKWLNNDSDSKTAEELWGLDLKYTLKNLHDWMENGGKLLKGKEKVVEKIATTSQDSSGKEKDKKKKKKKSE